MKEKVMKWCEYELKNAERGWDPHGAVTRCYGIIMFVSNEVLGFDTDEGKALAVWWDDVMLPKFRELY